MLLFMKATMCLIGLGVFVAVEYVVSRHGVSVKLKETFRDSVRVY